MNELTFTDQVRDDLDMIFNDCMMFELTSDQLENEYNSFSLTTKAELVEGRTDSDVREMVIDFICNKHVNKSWPCYGDSEERKELFFKELNEKFKELSYVAID
jgi:hypothetical protein